jgi:hypothetical protein
VSIFTHSAISPSLWSRQRPSRCAIRAGRNFVVIPCFQRDRLCLHLFERRQDLGRSTSTRREPACCHSCRFATPPTVRRGCDRNCSLSPKGSVVTGPYPDMTGQRASHGVTRRLSPRPSTRGSRVGLRRYERDGCTESPPHRATIHPTRNFAHLIPHVAMGGGPYLHLGVGVRGGWRMASEDSNTQGRLVPSKSSRDADNPILEPWPFLLIVRTGRIVTDTCQYRRIPRRFQHIASCAPARRRAGGQRRALNVIM